MRFGVACSAIHQSLLLVVARISIILCAQNHLVVLWEGNLSLLKVCEGPWGYMEGRPLILYNHFIQLYRTLDILFFECC